MSFRLGRTCFVLATPLFLLLAGVAQAAPPSYLGLESVPTSLGVGATGFTVECWMKMRTIAPTPYTRNPRVLHCIDPRSTIEGCGSSGLNA